jgi:fructose-1,6-bisphosphatase/inositol monophosphatase family enzyme
MNMNGSEAMADNTLKFASADLAVAHELADVADRISKAYFSPNGVSADTKADGSPVTEADHRIERELRAYLGRVLPQDAFIGEEFGAYGDAARRWIIDPIDGTVGFSAGLPWWSTLIGGEEDGEVVTGVITAPALRRRWWASAKGGAWTADWSDATAGTPAPLAVSTADELARSRTAVWPPLHRASEENRAKADRLTARSGDGRLLDRDLPRRTAGRRRQHRCLPPGGRRAVGHRCRRSDRRRGRRKIQRSQRWAQSPDASRAVHQRTAAPAGPGRDQPERHHAVTR